MRVLLALLAALPLIAGQAVTTFDDIHQTEDGFYMNQDKCFCAGVGGTCVGECGRGYDAAELTSKDNFMYGRFEASLYPNIDVNGTVATFFLYKNDSDKVAGASWQEIDYEVHGMGGHGEVPIQTNMITGNFTDREISEIFFGAAGHPSEIEAQKAAIKQGFHHFALEWTPEYVAWYFDGRRIRMDIPCEAEGADPETCSPQPAQLLEPMNLRISLWPCDPEPFWAEFWAGRFNPETLPLTIYFDYVKAYDYDPVTKGFTLKWVDEFETLNTTLWEVGAHTFDVNYAHFTPEKAVIVKSEDHDPMSDGSYLALSITPKHEALTPAAPASSSMAHDEFGVTPLEQVYDDWNPPSKQYVLESNVCEAEGVMNVEGKRYEGGFGAFTTELASGDELAMEALPQGFDPTTADQSSPLQKCAAMCVEQYDTNECRFFSVFAANSTIYCSGFHAPEHEIDDPTAMGGVVCSGMSAVAEVEAEVEVPTTAAPEEPEDTAQGEPEEEAVMPVAVEDEADVADTTTTTTRKQKPAAADKPSAVDEETALIEDKTDEAAEAKEAAEKEKATSKKDDTVSDADAPKEAPSATQKVVDEAADASLADIEDDGSASQASLKEEEEADTSVVPVNSPLEPSEEEAATADIPEATKVQGADVSETTLDEAATEDEGAGMPIWVILAVVAAAILAVAGLAFFVSFVMKRRAEAKAEAQENAPTTTHTPQSATNRV
ncbi:unnamed protein product [Vitrella brassicaformis CCMP3155]|uniref:GH16 domain-containing protein n=2 Tax=Vitrella brassicaformis TaxID=1169539 RepID=A0A0G4FMX6_VITBC|nr:unnamed protein product [Vitrella brassicaformis CCMP3155]|eukprot:CEM15598.1 unnamed protein product [Vitrella brassicaformis CCMP3155]